MLFGVKVVVRFIDNNLKTAKNITILILSLMICYTSSGINLFVHVCGGNISGFSLSEADAGCGMEKSLVSIAQACKSSLNDVDLCCQNHTIANTVNTQIIEKTNIAEVTVIAKLVPLYFISLQNFFQAKTVNDLDSIPIYRLFVSSYFKRGVYLYLQNFRN